MSIAELPYSVRVIPNSSPDKTSLAYGTEVSRVIEPKGLTHKPYSDRQFIFKEEGEKQTSITYHISPQVDSLVFHPEDMPSSRYVSKNGVYVEVGVVSKEGQASVRFDIDNGKRLLTQLDLTAFPYFHIPDRIKTQNIEKLAGIFEELKTKRIPHPNDFMYVSDFINSRINISEPFHQPALFEI